MTPELIAEWRAFYGEPEPDRPAHADAVMVDLGAAITEGVTEARLREALKTWLRDTDHDWTGVNREDPYGAKSDALLALPEMRALLDSAATVQRVEALAARWAIGDYGLNGDHDAAVMAARTMRATLGGEGS